MRFFATVVLLFSVLVSTAQVNDSTLVLKLVDFGFKTSLIEREIKALILHSTFNASFPTIEEPDTFSVKGVIKQFEQYKVAAHYLIGRDGVIYQLVKDENIAFHAGKSQLPDGTTDVNACSIGIEIICTYTVGPNEEQYASLRKLIDQLDSNYKFKYILPHYEIAPGRKTDPWQFEDNGYFRK